MNRLLPFIALLFAVGCNMSEEHIPIDAKDDDTNYRSQVWDAAQWDETLNAWITQVRTNVFGWIEVMISTDGVTSPPTARQLSTLDLVANLPSASLADVTTQARVYAEEYMMEDEYEELTDTDFELRFSTCMIPRLRDTPDHYFFLIGNSEIDEEHGIACLFKNHESTRICHTDVAYDNYGWDDTALLEFVLRS